MLSQHEIQQIALEQSAQDMNCEAGDFLLHEARVFLSRENPQARIYHDLPFPLQLVSYGTNVVASTCPELRQGVAQYLSRHSAVRALEFTALWELQALVESHGLQLTEIAQRYLPKIDALHEIPSAYPIRRLHREEFASLYRPEFSNALSHSRPEFDELVLAAYDGDTVVGLAGASRDAHSMMQIGIDVLPSYRRQGIGASLVSCLTAEILGQGLVPFYTTAISNVASARLARVCGYEPAWVELSFTKRS